MFIENACYKEGKKVMPKLSFDFVIVGAGIVGSWTAKELRKYGKVLLLEQFREPHTRGSSHGQSRLIRSGYAEPFFADLMPHAFKMWRQAEVETNEKLIETTGVLYMADSSDNKKLTDTINNMKRLCPENLIELKGSDIKSKYPETLMYDDNCGVVFDKSGGVLFAHKAVNTIQKWFQNSGGLFWDSCKVTEIIPKENEILVKTCKNDVTAKSLVVTAGPWTKQLLSNLAPSLPLEAQAVKVYYWKEKKKGVYSASSGFPATRFLSYPRVYTIPSLEYPGLVKVCYHSGVPVDPDERDKTVMGKEHENIIADYIKKHFPLLETEPAITEMCMYTGVFIFVYALCVSFSWILMPDVRDKECTPDEIFLIDRLPGHKNIVIGTGFSGTGFKTAPAVARLLSELARGVEPFLDVSHYSLSRFSK